jgi:cell wall-associated NlpC family hydrolase
MKHKRHISLLLSLAIVIALPQLVLASKTHVVRKSESLHTIARKYRVAVSEIKSVNSLNGTKIAKGTRLIIPSDSVDHVKKAKVVEKASAYRVVTGDTLPKIARKTGIRMADLRRLNGLRGNRVKPGQLLALNASRPDLDTAPAAPVATERLKMVNRELLNEQEFSDTLAELTDIDADRPVDLAKNLEDSSSNSSSISRLKKTAYSFLGARYQFGGNSRNALDCSSFIQQVFRDHHVYLPRTAREQFNVGMEVPRGDLQKGDLVFFQTYASFPSHVGIYLGNRKMIHASSRDRRVVISSMDTPYYLSRFLGARRIGISGASGISGSERFNELLSGVEEERESDVVANDTLGLALTRNN